MSSPGPNRTPKCRQENDGGHLEAPREPLRGDTQTDDGNHRNGDMFLAHRRRTPQAVPSVKLCASRVTRIRSS